MPWFELVEADHAVCLLSASMAFAMALVVAGRRRAASGLIFVMEQKFYI